MAKHISEILAIEKNRKDSQTYNVIHLFKEGAFYRAYEWSAWINQLLSRYSESHGIMEDSPEDIL